MAKHNVFFSAPNLELGKSDIVLEVRKDGDKFGTITISKGAIEWRPSKHKSHYKLSWTDFDKAFRSQYGE